MSYDIDPTEEKKNTVRDRALKMEELKKNFPRLKLGEAFKIGPNVYKVTQTHSRGRYMVKWLGVEEPKE